MSNTQTNKPRKGPGGPGHMMAPGEKPKNFKSLGES